MSNSPTMQVEVEPSATATGKWNARCGPYEVRGVRTPLLTMARKLLDNGENPDVELRLTHKGSPVDDAPNGHGAKFAPFRSNLEDLAE
jgi:hypothetical protein